MIKERNCQSDLIRVVGMFFVIGVHSLNYINNYPMASIIINSFIFSCNPMFFMLSGKFNLLFNSGENEKLTYFNFYKKKFINIFIPFLVYSFLIHIYDYKNSLTPLTSIKTFCKNFLTNNVSFHLWFMYILIGLLISTPFLAKLVQALSDFELKLFIAIGVIWNFISIIVMSDIFNNNFGFSGWLITGWLLYFLLGYFCERIIKTKKQVLFFIIIGIICFIITNLQRIYLPNNSINVCDLSPIYTFFVLSIYLLLNNILIIKNNVIQKIISFVAKYSFSVYLIHISVLRFWPIHAQNIQLLQNANNFIRFFLCVFITFLISFVVAFCIDNTVIKVIKKLLLKLLPIKS